VEKQRKVPAADVDPLKKWAIPWENSPLPFPDALIGSPGLSLRSYAGIEPVCESKPMVDNLRKEKHPLIGISLNSAIL